MNTSRTTPCRIQFLRHRASAALLLWLSGLTLLALQSHAGNLYVPNASFESQPTPFADPRVDFWQKPPQPPGFDTNTFGAWENLAGVFANAPSTNADYIDNADNSQLAYLFAYPGMALFQDYNSTDWSGAPPTHAFNSIYEAGKSYHLTVGLTSSSEEPLTQGSTLLLSLYYRDASSNVVTVASTTVTYDTNVFTNITHLLDFHVDTPTVKTNDAWAGKNIGIQLMSTVSPLLIGGVWDADNVRLTESIEVLNYSFESQPTAFADPRVDSWQKPPQPPTFDTNIFGAWENLAGVFANAPSTNADYIDNAVGSQLAYLFAYPQMALFQDNTSTDWSGAPPAYPFNARYKPGKAYTLTVGLTSSREEPLSQGSTLLMSLYYRDAASNMVTVASTIVTYDTNVFTNINHLLDFSATIPLVKPSDPWAGKTIGVQFMSIVNPLLIGGVWDMDNVRLTEVVANVMGNSAKSNSNFNFNLASEPGLAFDILAATNVNQAISNWSNLGKVTNVTGSLSFTDNSASPSRRFYRARRSN